MDSDFLPIAALIETGAVSIAGGELGSESLSAGGKAGTDGANSVLAISTAGTVGGRLVSACAIVVGRTSLVRSVTSTGLPLIASPGAGGRAVSSSAFAGTVAGPSFVSMLSAGGLVIATATISAGIVL